ncbi:ABC transporter ATP-binding protein [Brevibacterium linens]|uniref:ABC transporter ATP-binding protein n=1 Tax=Brevibacterium linens TaxID=1703 RepID=UPI0013DF0AEF|nr:ABC transporter ATP-binding protein [Brevibacterium linens]
MTTRARGFLVLCVAGALVAAVAEVCALAAIGHLTAALLAADDPAPPARAMIICTIVWVCASAAAIIGGRSCGYSLSNVIHESLAHHLLRLPLAWFGPRRHGQISRLFGPDVMSVMSIPAHLLIPLLRTVLTVSSLAVLIMTIDVVAGAVMIGWLPVLAGLQVFSARRAGTSEAALAHARGEAADRLIEFAEAQRSIRLLPSTSRTTAVSRSLDAVGDRTQEQVEAVLTVLSVFGAAVQLMTVTVIAAPLLRGADLAPADLFVIVLAVSSAAALLHSAAGLSATIRAALGSWREIRTFLSLPSLAEPVCPAKQTIPGDVRVENIDVDVDAVSSDIHSQPSARILSDVTLHAPAGTLTVLLGPSGSGKSTVLCLLARFFDPTSGTVRIGGAESRLLGSEGVHSTVAMVFQDVEIFSGSIAENIRLGNPHASEDDLTAAIEASGLSDLISTLPHGADSVIGEHGSGLSGGQKQRLSLARAFISEAPILLLDEPTSHLDAHHRDIVLSAIADMRGSRTVILSTHDTVAARTADNVIVLEQGRITGQGTWAQLTSADGPFADGPEHGLPEAHSHMPPIQSTYATTTGKDRDSL